MFDPMFLPPLFSWSMCRLTIFPDLSLISYVTGPSLFFTTACIQEGELTLMFFAQTVSFTLNVTILFSLEFRTCRSVSKLCFIHISGRSKSNFVRNSRPNIIFAGVSPVVQCFVVLYSNNIISIAVCMGLFLLNKIFIFRLNVLTKFSAAPFDAGCLTAESVCLIPNFFRKSVNVLLVYYGPLSLTT